MPYGYSVSVGEMEEVQSWHSPHPLANLLCEDFTLCEHRGLTLSCSTHHEETEVWSPVTHTGQEHNFMAKFMFFQKYKLE